MSKKEFVIPGDVVNLEGVATRRVPAKGFTLVGRFDTIESCEAKAQEVLAGWLPPGTKFTVQFYPDQPGWMLEGKRFAMATVHTPEHYVRS